MANGHDSDDGYDDDEPPLICAMIKDFQESKKNKCPHAISIFLCIILLMVGVVLFPVIVTVLALIIIPFAALYYNYSLIWEYHHNKRLELCLAIIFSPITLVLTLAIMVIVLAFFISFYLIIVPIVTVFYIL